MDRALMLSHHPLCKDFLDHSFRIGNHRVCKGCLIGYPTALAIIVIGVLSPLIDDVPFLSLFFLTLIIFCFNLLKLTPLGRSGTFSIFLKFVRGLTLGFGILTTWKAPGLQDRILVFTFFFACYLIYIYAGVRRHIKVCQRCMYYPTIPECPGLDIKDEGHRETSMADHGNDGSHESRGD